MSGRSYDGPALDGTVQYITERPALEEQAAQVEYATDPEDVGEERAENVPVPEPDAREEVERPDGEGQTTFADWGWSA